MPIAAVRQDDLERTIRTIVRHLRWNIAKWPCTPPQEIRPILGTLDPTTMVVKSVLSDGRAEAQVSLLS